MDWFQTEKGVGSGCTLSPSLLSSYAECSMQNAELDESQAGIKTAGRNINSLRNANENQSNGQKQRGTKEPFDEGERGE